MITMITMIIMIIIPGKLNNKPLRNVLLLLQVELLFSKKRLTPVTIPRKLTKELFKNILPFRQIELIFSKKQQIFLLEQLNQEENQLNQTQIQIVTMMKFLMD